ncbi:hypothetical protein LSH36_43g04079 [Paralvinella palmiformis]|uniref:RanBP2-type domain-containing protein n=1 Tax=Paralvinella palmiformis TaxID=53620 RepID=A0AAD9K6S0_9ANNE|nr:hypothetical protein LSH36_43g04079 [Paralvinella palmiformis]
MADGDNKQVQCLTNADAYKPKKREPGDLSVLLQTPQPKNQKSIADFFTPKGDKNRSMMNIRLMDKTNFKTDVDNDAFASPTSENSEKRKRKINSFAFESKEMAELHVNNIEQGFDDTEEILAIKSKRRRINGEKVINDPDVSKEMSLNGSSHECKMSKRQMDMWSCTACTFINSSMLPYCEICSSPKRNRHRISKRDSDLSVETDNRNTFDSAENEGSSAVRKNQSLNSQTCGTNLNLSQSESDRSNSVDVTEEQTIDDDVGERNVKSVISGVSKAIPEGHHSGEKTQKLESSNGSFTHLTKTLTPPRTVCDATDHVITSNASSAECPSTPETNNGHRIMRESDVSFGGSNGDNPKEAAPDNGRLVDLDNVPVYNLFKYCCSKNTSRIYLYDEAEKSLDINFTPLDVEMENYPELPELLLRPENLKLVKRFVREWNSLVPTKRRLIVKSGRIFTSPCFLYEELKSTRQHNTQRYTSKLDIATAAVSKAEQIGGSVRVIHQPKLQIGTYTIKENCVQDSNPSAVHVGKNQTGTDGPLDDSKIMLSSDTMTEEQLQEHIKGIVQVISEDGTPLCIHCQKPYYTDLVTKKTIEKNMWQTRFCSQLCMDQYWMKGSRGYSMQQVYQTEHGICQLCDFDAQQLYDKIKNTTNLYKRAKLIQESKYGTLKTAIKQKMANNPVRGLFWQVDHIKPVIEGGGTCDIDNLRTLCVLCHREVTAQLHRDRAEQRHKREAAKCGDITAFFKVK